MSEFRGNGDLMGDAGRRITITFFGNTLAPLASLVTAPLLARGLGVEGRGEVAAAIAPLILGATIATVGLPSAATYFVAQMPRLARYLLVRAGVVLLATGAIATGLVVVVSPWLSQENHEVQQLILFSAVLIIPTMLVVLLQGVSSGLHQWNRVFAERTISATLRVIAITTLFATDNLTPASAVIVLSLTPLIGGLAYIQRRPNFESQGSEPNFSSIMHFGARVWVGALSGILLSRLDQTLMAPLSSTAQLGYYAVAVSLSELALVTNNSIREVMFADLSRSFDRERLTAASRISTICAFGIATPIAIGTVLLLPTIFGADFQPATSVTLILILAVILGNPGSMAGVGLSAIGNPGRRSISLFIACLVNLILIVTLVPPWGAMGAAVATLIGNLVSSNLNIWFMWRLERMRPSEFYRFSASDVATLERALRRLVRTRS